MNQQVIISNYLQFLQNKEKIKEHLSKVSSILQYLSFETIEAMLYSMKTLKFEKIRNEFIMLTLFHGEEFCSKLEAVNINKETKDGFQKLVQEFLHDLFELTGFNP